MPKTEMERALEADGEKLRQLTGEDHGPWEIVTCKSCDGLGVHTVGTWVYEHGCGYGHSSSDEIRCEECNGAGEIFQAAEGVAISSQQRANEGK